MIDALRDTVCVVRATRIRAWVDRDLQLEWSPPPAFIDNLCLYAPPGYADNGNAVSAAVGRVSVHGTLVCGARRLPSVIDRQLLWRGDVRLGARC